MSVPESYDVVICRVNGRSITLSKVAPALKVEGRWTLVDEAIREAILEEAVESRGITASDEELQLAADAFRAGHKLHSAAETAAWLRRNNISTDDFEKGLLRGLTLAKLRDGIDHDEVRRYFFDNLKRFQWVRFSQIVTKEQGTSEELLAQLRDEEEDFARLARRYSIDAASRQAGGYAGTVKRRDLSLQLEAAMFSAVLEEVLGPVETRMGWHLIKVWERGGGELDDEAATAARDAVFEHWLKRQIERACVEVNV